MPRRLPVYLLLDTSGSMSGEPIESLKSGLQMLVSALRGEPQALETAYLSIITFESVATQVVPLTDLISFQEPNLTAGGGTAMGEALELVAHKIDMEVTKTTASAKGDWKPLVFIFTDGEPTDDIKNGVQAIKSRRVTVVACGAGFNVNTNTLKQITESVVLLQSATQSDMKAFFKWVTASVTQASQKIDSGSDQGEGLGELPPPPPEINVVA